MMARCCFFFSRARLRAFMNISRRPWKNMITPIIFRIHATKATYPPQNIGYLFLLARGHFALRDTRISPHFGSISPMISLIYPGYSPPISPKILLYSRFDSRDRIVESVAIIFSFIFYLFFFSLFLFFFFFFFGQKYLGIGETARLLLLK